MWISPELLVSLNLQVGDTLLLGDAALPITELLVIEPDRGTGGFMRFSPRVLMNEADLPATHLVQPASRINYRFAVVADEPARVSAFQQWASARIEGKGAAGVQGEREGAREGEGEAMRGVRVEQLDSGQPAMQTTLARAQKFLNLVALLAALLSAVAVAIAARDFARRHLDDFAMLRVLGQPQSAIAWGYIIEFSLAGVVASAFGVLSGYALHYVFIALLAQLLGQNLPAFFGMGVGLTLLVAFGLPPVLQLSKVPPLCVLRRDLGDMRPAAFTVLAVGTLGFMVLLVVVSRDTQLGLITVGGFAAAVAVFAILVYGIVLLLKPLGRMASAPAWLRLAVRSLTARPAVVVTQVSALSIGLLALILLVLLRTDLISSWQQATPPDAPDRFIISVMPEQADDFQQRLQQAGVKEYDWYPMIRGRLVAVNDKPVNLDDYESEQARKLMDRGFNLSYATELPGYNQVVKGAWVVDEADGASVEAGLMDTLGLKMGDVLRFDVAGIVLERKITSVRGLDWSSMHVNFFVMFPQAQMPDYPETYITAFRAPDDRCFDDQLTREFPNITSINVSAMLAQIQQVLNQMIRAVEFLFVFSLLAGLIVLFAAIAATREQRAHEFAVMRALGASNKLLKRVQTAELMGTGAVAGLVASLVAMVIAAALAKYAFDFVWAPPLWAPLGGIVTGVVLAWVAGWLRLRSVLKRPVIQTLRVVLD